MKNNERIYQNGYSNVETVSRSNVTVNRVHNNKNGMMKYAAKIIKNDIVGFFNEVRSILRQTEGLEAYATCKGSRTCSDAIEEYHVHIPPMYDEILNNKPMTPTPGAATAEVLGKFAKIIDDAGSMEAYANRHQAFPGDPTKFDPNRPQSRLFAKVDNKIRSNVQVTEELRKEA